MTGYTRADSVNNIADGNIINASDLDGEFDAVQAAFNNSTGHVHDGTAANGAPITKIGPTQDVVASAIALLPKTTATVDVGSSSLKFKDFFFSGAGSVTGTITAGGFSGTVGATTPAAGTFTSLSDSGNLTFTGTGNRITGDTNNATVSSRLFFQSSTTNGSTSFGVLPNGTSLVGGYQAYNNSDPTNAAFIQMATSAGTEARLTSGITGTGTYLPMTFYTGGSERMRLDTSGRVIIGTTTAITTSLQTLQFDSGTLNTAITATSYGVNPSISLRAAGGTAASPSATVNNPINIIGGTTSDGTTFFNTIQITGIIESTPSAGSHPTAIAFSTTPSGSTSRSERMRIDSSGNVGIGTSSPNAGAKLHLYSSVVSNAGILRIQHSSGSYNAGLVLLNGNSTNGGNLFIDGVGGLQLIQADNSYLVLGTNNTERARIDSSGNVGIGTGSPATYGRFAVVSGGDYAPAATFISNSSAVNWARADWKNVNVAYSGIIYQDSSGLFNIRNDGANAIAFLTNAVERMRIDSSGNVLVTNPAGLGYGTGSGGTVTQATSKSTAVTLNKPTGQITMNNAALAAGGVVEFVFNNSLATNNDLIMLTLANQIGAYGNYNLWGGTFSGGGGFYINVKNISGGSLSDALVINFAIIKGATA